MIFYIATDDTGKKHALTVHGEALKIDKKPVQVDIGVTKADLKTLLQDSFDKIHDLEQQISGSRSAEGLDGSQEQVASDVPSQPQAETSVQPAPDWNRDFTAAEIENFILNHASVNQCAGIHSCLGTRFAEVIKDNRQPDISDLPNVMACPESKDSHAGCPTCNGKWYVRLPTS